MLLLLGMGTISEDAFGQEVFVYNGVPLKQVIEDIESRKQYQFLYRDALVSGKYVSFEASENSLFATLESALTPQFIEVKIDEKHRQILLSEAARPIAETASSLTGQIIDAETGARLPFASLTWMDRGKLRGVSANAAGAFQFSLIDAMAQDSIAKLTISYVGYKTRQLELSRSKMPTELSIRLEPEPLLGQEVLVNSTFLHTDLDTTWHHLIQGMNAMPFGESSVLRSLQPLPAVALNTAFSEGLNVRGSKADGFQVLLDGAPIYNQNHFFGMFDVFNNDALQTVGFFYDIAPASYFAPPGGTISFITRPGSVQSFKSTIGFSNAAVRATVEGPIARGKSSWLVSGRYSYIDKVNWFNNERLIGVGLDTIRSISDLPNNAADLDEFTIFPGNTSALFYDVHSKLTHETPGGGRATLSLYVGGNTTQLDAERLYLERDEETDILETVRNPVSTLNSWGNEAASFQLHHRVGNKAYLQTVLAASHYYSKYDKDDFTFTRLNANGRPQNFIFPFTYDNELFDLKLAQHLDFAPNRPGIFSAGFSTNFYALTYKEQSATRPAFGEDYYALQFDAYSEYERTNADILNMRIGLRGHFFTQGNAIRLSPRLQFTLFPQSPLSFRIGYSRNYQFLHHLYLENTNSASIWVITTGSSKPSQVDNITSGIYFKPVASAFIQVEGYMRAYDHLRRHEINGPTQFTTENMVRFTPWFSENQARAKGLEVMYRQRIGPLIWTHSYTLSRVEMQNNLVNNGEWFMAEWDRRHQYTSNLQINLHRSIGLNLSWFYATGNPNVLSFADEVEESRLPDYHRLDANIQWARFFGSLQIQARASVYNLYDQVNTWYREPIQVFNQNRSADRFIFYPVDVYDIGLQPSFDVSITF